MPPPLGPNGLDEMHCNVMELIEDMEDEQVSSQLDPNFETSLMATISRAKSRATAGDPREAELLTGSYGILLESCRRAAQRGAGARELRRIVGRLQALLHVTEHLAGDDGPGPIGSGSGPGGTGCSGACG